MTSHLLQNMTKPTIILLMMLCYSQNSHAERRTIHIEIVNHLFFPDKIEIRAGERVKLVITNKDATPEEFESYELNREKVIMGGRKANIFVGPLEPGIYPFFGEFNEKTAQGKLIVTDKSIISNQSTELEKQ